MDIGFPIKIRDWKSHDLTPHHTFYDRSFCPPGYLGKELNLLFWYDIPHKGKQYKTIRR